MYNDNCKIPDWLVKLTNEIDQLVCQNEEHLSRVRQAVEAYLDRKMAKKIAPEDESRDILCACALLARAHDYVVQEEPQQAKRFGWKVIIPKYELVEEPPLPPGVEPTGKLDKEEYERELAFELLFDRRKAPVFGSDFDRIGTTGLHQDLEALRKWLEGSEDVSTANAGSSPQADDESTGKKRRRGEWKQKAQQVLLEEIQRAGEGRSDFITTYTELAERVGVARTTVSRYLKKHGYKGEDLLVRLWGQLMQAAEANRSKIRTEPGRRRGR